MTYLALSEILANVFYYVLILINPAIDEGKKGVNIIPTHSKNPAMFPKLDKLAPKNVYLLRDGYPYVISTKILSLI